MFGFVSTLKGRIVPVASYSDAAPLVERGGSFLSDASLQAGCVDALAGVRAIQERLRSVGLYGEADECRRVAAMLSHCLSESGIVTTKGAS